MTVLSSGCDIQARPGIIGNKGKKGKEGVRRGAFWGERIPQRKAEWLLFEELFIPCIRFQLSDQLILLDEYLEWQHSALSELGKWASFFSLEGESAFSLKKSPTFNHLLMVFLPDLD